MRAAELLLLLGALLVLLIALLVALALALRRPSPARKNQSESPLLPRHDPEAAAARPATGGNIEPPIVQASTPVASGLPATPRSEPPAGAGPTAWILTALGGSQAGRRYGVPPAGLRIGRLPDNEVILQENMVSRYHAVIAMQSGCYVLYDRNSANGTYVNGVRVFERSLRPGDRIQIGISEFVLHAANAPIPATPAIPGSYGAPGEGGIRTETFEGYRVEGLIGGGGMAAVYRARAADGHVVAIKIPKIANDTYLMRKFVREGTSIAALLRHHPHIVQVERFGYASDGIPYIVMEYVDGGSLRERMCRGLNEEETRRIVGQTCLALGVAHQYRIVHRDIKPENILLTQQDVAKVADFGIAKELSGVTFTRQGAVGTPEYMSPEQAQGEEIRPASDIYAAGIVLYELLVGRVPFPRRPTPGSNDVQQALDVVGRQVKETPRPIRDLRSDVSPDLERVALRALEKDWRKRFKNGNDMAVALNVKPVAVAAPAAAAAAHLVITQGAHAGHSLQIAREVVEIGRPDIDPANASISRRHIVIHQRGSDLWLQDVSTNGTWVNNRRVSGEQLLSPGDRIGIGDCQLRLEA